MNDTGEESGEVVPRGQRFQSVCDEPRNGRLCKSCIGGDDRRCRTNGAELRFVSNRESRAKAVEQLVRDGITWVESRYATALGNSGQGNRFYKRTSWRDQLEQALARKRCDRADDAMVRAKGQGRDNLFGSLRPESEQDQVASFEYI